MSGKKFDLMDLYHVIRHTIVSEVHTMLPGKIVKYYPDTQTADVQPMLKRVYWSQDTAADGTPPGHKVYASYGTIPNVPVEFPGGSGFILTFPLGTGDTCDIEFSEASMADYLATGQESSPQDVSRHSLAHAVCHPIYCPSTSLTDSAITGNDRMVIGQAGGIQMQITGSEIIFGAGATDFVALASLVKSNLDKLQAAFDSHVHATAGTGSPSPPTAVPGVVPVGSLPAVASSLVKSK